MYNVYCVYCIERDGESVREREEMPTAGKPGVEKTGFVYTDAQTVHLARLTAPRSPPSLSHVNTHEK